MGTKIQLPVDWGIIISIYVSAQEFQTQPIQYALKKWLYYSNNINRIGHFVKSI